MKVRNKHGRVGVKRPLSGMERRRAFLNGFERGRGVVDRSWRSRIMAATSLRALKKEAERG